MSDTIGTYTGAWHSHTSPRVAGFHARGQQSELGRRLSRLAWRAMILAIEVRDVDLEQAQGKAIAALDELAEMIVRVREAFTE